MNNITLKFDELALFSGNAEIAMRLGFIEGGWRESGQMLASITFYDKLKHEEGAAVAMLDDIPWLNRHSYFTGWHWSLNKSTGELMCIFDPNDTDRLDYLISEGIDDFDLVRDLRREANQEDKIIDLDDHMQNSISGPYSFARSVLFELMCLVDIQETISDSVKSQLRELLKAEKEQAFEENNK